MKKTKLPLLKTNRVIKKAEKSVVPKAEIGLKMDATFSLSTLRSSIGADLMIQPSKAFNEVPTKDFNALFVKKCQDCCYLCDFTGDSDGKIKHIKTGLLRQIINGLNMPQLMKSLQPASMKEFFCMLSTNLFRDFPSVSSICPIDAHDCVFDSAWPHISIIYETLTAFINSSLPQISLSSSFLYHLIGNSLSPDEREKAIVRDLLYLTYSKLVGCREIIRKNISYYFSSLLASYELIEFYNSIVSGFSIPLKQDHISFYEKYFLALHSSPNFLSFHIPYVQCLIKYISKSNSSIVPTVLFISKHWPCSDKKKQLVFIAELSELFVVFESLISQDLAIPIFKQISMCTLSESQDVSASSFDFLMNPDILPILTRYSHILYPIIMDPVTRAAKTHWDECTQTNALVTLQILSEIDQKAYSRATEVYKNRKYSKCQSFKAFKDGWAAVFDAAKSADRSITSINMDILRDRVLTKI